LLGRQSVANISLNNQTQPDYFDRIVDIRKKLSTDKQKPALNWLMAVTQKYCTALHKLDTQGQEDATNFKRFLSEKRQ